jgi:outer membrane lipoprotein LolB
MPRSPTLAALWEAASRTLLLAAAVVAVAGCAGLPAATATPERHYAGRFSLVVTHPESGDAPAQESWSGRFSLSLEHGATSLDLVSPLGATIARLETEPGGARLSVPEGASVRTRTGVDARALSEDVLGWYLPVDGMGDWLEGRPAQARPYRPLDAAPGQSRFEQDGWSVTVDAVSPERPGRRLQIDRAAQGRSPAIALRVVLDAPAG